ncbi:MAG: hypothetical protein JWM10_4734, partial [Myxococcaceae bacterium]|nr:hypothetical protein [Myxococcaceae bacterium]
MRVESELEWGPGRTVQSVVLTVRRGGHDGAVRSVRTTALGAPPERQALPLYVGVIPLDGDTDAPLWIEALGCGGPNGCAAAQAVVAQRAIVRFSPGETLELPLLLATACVGAACAVDQRCVEGGRCEVATRAQEAVRPFAGVPTPTGTDAGSTDAGPGVDGTVPADVEPPPDRPPIADAGALDHAAIPG